jgi:hypothetical protein
MEHVDTVIKGGLVFRQPGAEVSPAD